MTEHAAQSDFVGTAPTPKRAREALAQYTSYWWLFLVAGIAWILISVVILQFDQASITTVGVLVGLLFLLAALQNAVVAYTDAPYKWAWILFAVLFGASAVVCFINPKDTFAGMADILGFLFLMVGLWWMIRAFIEKAINPTWWLGLIAGILMTCMAFWTAGQFFITKAYVLLVFAGIWALMEGITDIVRAFEVREVHKQSV
jgi:uncharacterized membrane protein HdeD (DUF308 family)